MDFRKANKVNLLLIFHYENTSAHEIDIWAKIAEKMNESMRGHAFDGIEEFSAETVEVRHKKLMEEVKLDVYSEFDGELLILNEDYDLDDEERWDKIADRLNKSIKDKFPESNIHISGEAAKHRYEVVAQWLNEDAGDETDSQAAEADDDADDDSLAYDADNDDIQGQGVIEPDTEDEGDAGDDRKPTKSEIEGEINFKVCARHMHQCVHLKYEVPDWTEISEAVNDYIEEKNFQGVAKYTAEMAEARFHALKAEDNFWYRHFSNVRKVLEEMERQHE